MFHSTHDFRSDFATVPTPSMLQPILESSSFDAGASSSDTTTQSLETLMTKITGKPSALLVLSGIMANQVTFRTILSQHPYSIVCDSRSHILNMEAGGAATLCGAMFYSLNPQNGHHLTISDIRKAAVVRKSIFSTTTRIISLEIPLNGIIMPLEDAREISVWARGQEPPIHMHLDGARVWEVEAAGAGTVEEYCELFDSVALCFAKGLGAPMGSVLVGFEEFIERARWARKLLGGSTRGSSIIAAPAKVAIHEVFLLGKLVGAQEMARRLAGYWTSLGGELSLPTETNMVWMKLDDPDEDWKVFVKLAKQRGLILLENLVPGRVVVHYQISKEAVSKLEAVMSEFLVSKEMKLE